MRKLLLLVDGRVVKAEERWSAASSAQVKMHLFIIVANGVAKWLVGNSAIGSVGWMMSVWSARAQPASRTISLGRRTYSTR